MSRKAPHSIEHRSPKKARRNAIIQTSQSSQVGLYPPTCSNILSRRRDDVQEGVDNWRHGRSAYRCDILSPLRFASNSTRLGSPLSPFTDFDPIVPSNAILSLRKSQCHLSASSDATAELIRTGATDPCACDPQRLRTAGIIAEIRANVRAKRLSDDEYSYLHAPLKEQLSSEKGDDELSWNTSDHISVSRKFDCCWQDRD